MVKEGAAIQSAYRAQSGSAHFDTPREGMASPLAKRLFAIEGVTGVFYGSDFVTVTKAEDQVWSMLKPEVFAAIMEHFTSGVPAPPLLLAAHSVGFLLCNCSWAQRLHGLTGTLTTCRCKRHSVQPVHTQRSSPCTQHLTLLCGLHLGFLCGF